MKKTYIIVSLLICISLLLGSSACSYLYEASSEKKREKKTEAYTEKSSESKTEKMTESDTETENEHTDDEVTRLMKSLTLKQKLAQMLMPAFRVWNKFLKSTDVTELNDEIRTAISEFDFGGVILFSQNTKDAAQTVRLVSEMQNAAISSDGKIPMLISVDQEGGYVTRLGTGTGFCGNMALGATNGISLIAEAASVIGAELKAEGINLDFAPVMDVNSEPSNPVIRVRSFSDSPPLAEKCGIAFISGLQKSGVAAAMKRFPGHGDTKTDSHSGLPCIYKSLDELLECELVPFIGGIEAGADVTMTAHIQYPEIEKNTYVSVSTGQKNNASRDSFKNRDNRYTSRKARIRRSSMYGCYGYGRHSR